MDTDVGSRGGVAKQIIALTRFAILCTLALGGVLLVADFLGRGWVTAELRFLSERVVMALIYGIAIEVVGAIAATTCVALWK